MRCSKCRLARLCYPLGSNLTLPPRSALVLQERVRFEATALMQEARHCPEHVPEVYHFDETMAVIVMQVLAVACCACQGMGVRVWKSGTVFTGRLGRLLGQMRVHGVVCWRMAVVWRTCGA
jgi:hypothetical protein